VAEGAKEHRLPCASERKNVGWAPPTKKDCCGVKEESKKSGGTGFQPVLPCPLPQHPNRQKNIGRAVPAG